jgi:diketogulonate reductase-like aldo/keto reductase
LREIMDAIKGASAHKINRQLGRTGKLWQTESYDRVLRSSENSMRRLSTSLTIRFEKD